MEKNSNIEIRNPKQCQNPNAQNLKQKRHRHQSQINFLTIFVFLSIEWTHKRKNSHYISMIR
ncbi:hypothetical protein D1AOALGA4SA_8076 [Olavius algarvensis Delta 1 endosymbiont]|nr:hypothetical protein D1AOALGA4SA_8076 [Olavius algarvensis Delta 1 endosymbiont]